MTSNIKPGPTYVLGADNGLSGFVVLLNTDPNLADIIEYIEPYPREEPIELFNICNMWRPKCAAVEQPFMAGGFKKVASTNFEVLGRYKQTFERCTIPYSTVSAVAWRKDLGIKATATHNDKGEPISKRDSNKLAGEAFAKQFFSENDWQKLHSTWGKNVNGKRVHITGPDDNKVESALIALYALKQWRQINAKN